MWGPGFDDPPSLMFTLADVLEIQDELERLRRMRSGLERLHKEMNKAYNDISPVAYWLSAIDDLLGIE